MVCTFGSFAVTFGWGLLLGAASTALIFFLIFRKR